MDEPLSALTSMEIMNKAYQDVLESEPFLPFEGSVLPALLALRKTHGIIVQSNEYIGIQKASLEQINRRLETTKTAVEEQRALEVALEKRVRSLREGLESRKEMTPEQIAQEQINECKQKKQNYDKETKQLLRSLDWFIEEHLGPMLAAEELGGPVVGDMMEIDSGDLRAGFSAQGKPKKAKETPDDDDKRQRRIDEIWGPTTDQAGNAGKRKRDEMDEASAAAAEMRELIQELLNRSTESGGDSSTAYVKIPRESAAARFLVRSKVAIFDPKDATRLRLVDFGREVDD